MSEELIQQRDSLRQQLAEKDAKLVELKETVAKLEVFPCVILLIYNVIRHQKQRVAVRELRVYLQEA